MPPGAALSPQALINERTRNCDIYLGLMSARFGTPAEGHGSGTESEFSSALDRFRQDPTSVRLLFYFLPPANALSIDPDQLRHVQAFRKQIGGTVLWVDIDDTRTFPTRLRDDLRAILRDEWEDAGHWRSFGGEHQTGLATTTGKFSMIADTVASASGDNGEGSSRSEDQESHDDDIGLLDIAEQTEHSLEQATLLLQEAGAITHELSVFVTESTSKLNDGQSSGEKKAIVNGVATEMITVATRTRKIAQDLLSEYDRALNGMVSSVHIGAQGNVSEEDQGHIKGLCSILISNEEIIRTAIGQVEAYRSVIANIPRATSRMNLARKLTVGALGDMIASFVLVADRSREARAQINSVVADVMGDGALSE